jgi:hypothetical protein
MSRYGLSETKRKFFEAGYINEDVDVKPSVVKIEFITK